LAERVVLAADPAGLTLFGAWRTMSMPEDGPGARAAVVAEHLRGYRSGAHLLAIRAGGLTPPEALLASDQGEAAAIVGEAVSHLRTAVVV
jgi:Helix-turn-helix family